MKSKTLVMSAAVVLMSTAAAFAQCIGKQNQQAMSCAEGTVYDAETQSCQPRVNS